MEECIIQLVEEGELQRLNFVHLYKASKHLSRSYSGHFEVGHFSRSDDAVSITGIRR